MVNFDWGTTAKTIRKADHSIRLVFSPNFDGISNRTGKAADIIAAITVNTPSGVERVLLVAALQAGFACQKNMPVFQS